MGVEYKKLTLPLIILLAFILRVISLNQSLWLDEAINTLAVKNYSLVDLITQYARADFHPPGWFIILWFWTKFFGYSEIAVRMPSVIFGILTIYIVYLIGQKLHSKTLGLISALLLTINPLHIFYSQESRMYALAALTVSLNVFLFIKLVKGDQGSKGNLGEKVILILSNLLVLMSDYVAYLIFPAQFILLFFLKQKEFLKKWLIGLVGGVALSIWWLPIFLSQFDVGSVASASLPTWKFIVGGFDFKAVPLTFIKFIIGRISYPDKLIYGIVLLPVSVLFLFLILRGIKSIKNFEKKLLISWISIPIILATLISFVIPIYSYFRLLFTLPAFIILTSLGIISFKSKLRYTFLITVVLVQIFSSLIYLFNPSYQREDWKGLVSFFKGAQPPMILFESSGTLPPFDYYAKGSLNAKGALRDFPAKDESDVADLEDLLKNYKEAYLVDYLVQISDPNRLVAKKLLSLGYKETDVKDFHGVGFVYHYVK